MASIRPFKTDAKLTMREFAFADALLRGLGNIEAAKEAGFKGKTDQVLAVTAQRLLNNNNIREYINVETELKEIQRRKSIEVDDLFITQAFKEILNRCMQRVPVMRFDREAGMMTQERDEETGEGVWTFDSSGAIKAAENLGKHIGYYELDNKQRAPVIQVNITQNIQNNFIDEGDDISELTESGDPG